MENKTVYIVKDKEIFGGAPVIAGTRIPAERLGWLVEQGYTEGTLRKEFPHVPKKVIRGALSELILSGIRSI